MIFGRFLAFVAALFLATTVFAGPRKPKVVYIHTETSSPASAADVVSKILASGRFESVDTFNANLATPTITQLKAYDAALVANRNGWFDRNALGNVLADYVDAGYGVVLAPFTNAGTTNMNLGGRWTGSYNSILFSSNITGTATLGAFTLPDHQPSVGVQTFNGGSFSYRPSGTALQTGALVAFAWSDGKPLSTIGPLLNRADIGFYPTSSDINPGYWSTATDGAKIMANALLYVIRPKVLICAAAALNNSIVDPRFTDPRNKILSIGVFSAVDLYDANLATPTLAELQKYDVVLTWNNVSYKDPVALGNVLADYADWGGGVVVAMFASSGGSMGIQPLQGRWQTGGYQLIDSQGGRIRDTNATLGPTAYPNHPILGLVTSFDGGAISFRPASTALPAHAVLVAQWSDGKPLVVTSTIRRNRCDLGMYPPSSFVDPGFWQESTSGARILANALLYTARPYVGILQSGTIILPAPTRSRLQLQRRFCNVDVLTSLQTANPSAAELRPYGALLVWGDNNFIDPTGLGNLLADYVDAGGSVVVGLYSNAANPGANNRPKGRWTSQGYDITPESALAPTISGTNATLGTILAPTHPLATYVRKFDGGTSSIRQSTNPLIRGRRLMQWSDGKMLASVHNFLRRVDVGFFPPATPEYPAGWQVRTDGSVLLANALDFASSMKPCPGDFNGDGLVEDSDFVLFADYYQTFFDIRGDLTGDGVTDDADFVRFAARYDQLVCP
ncbi:MAG: hypothetical protein KF805_08035 [Phycisphaeraceae bacterium]|nr:hypothetical protein [Phycisphaeraceae bacterium]